MKNDIRAPNCPLGACSMSSISPSSILLSLCINLLLLHSGAQPRAPAPAPLPSRGGCNATALQSLSPCSTYVEASSNLTRPRKGCCGGLAAVLEAQPGCLCRLIDDYGGFGVRVDTTRALMLPTACRLDSPPANLCAVVGFPIARLPPAARGGPEENVAGIPASAVSSGGCSGLSSLPVRCFLFCFLLLLMPPPL